MVYVLGDLHLSLSVQKEMDVFGGVWTGYVSKLRNSLSILTNSDTLVLCGDHSWGMSLQESLEDFRFIDSFPGQKILLKGNHDYFWESKSKMEHFFTEHGLSTLKILYNNAYLIENTLICGTKGWTDTLEKRLLEREAGRLRLSLEAGKKLCSNVKTHVFLHYPPTMNGELCWHFTELFAQYNVMRCYYGHLHGHACAKALEGEHNNVEYRLISADHLDFNPLIVC